MKIWKPSMKMSRSNVVVVSINLQRDLLGIFLTTFVPTIILNLIGHMSNYFCPSYFEAFMSLNVTIMLSLTTIFISVSNNLPVTSYIKMIDVWLIFSLAKPAVDVIVQTYITYLTEMEGQKEEIR